MDECLFFFEVNMVFRNYGFYGLAHFISNTHGPLLHSGKTSYATQDSSGNRAADMHVKFQSDTTIVTYEIGASIFHEIWR